MIFFYIYCFGQFPPIKDVDFNEAKSEPYKSRNKNFRELCHKDSLRAVNDSKIQDKYSVYLIGPYSNEFLPVKEFANVLEKHNIFFGGVWVGSDLVSYDNDQCYKKYYNILTEKKRGKNFIDKLFKKAVRKYSKNHPDLFFNESTFLKIFYKGKKIEAWNEKNELNKEFNAAFLYPIDYIALENGSRKKSYSSVDIRINKRGKLVEILPIKHFFQNTKNSKFSEFFEKELIKFIKKSKWTPSEYCGQAVNSIFTVQFFYN